MLQEYWINSPWYRVQHLKFYYWNEKNFHLIELSIEGVHYISVNNFDSRTQVSI